MHDRPRLANRIRIGGFSQCASAALATSGFASIYADDLKIRAIIGIGIPYPTHEILSLRSSK
jgi:hypothetical protein